MQVGSRSDCDFFFENGARIFFVWNCPAPIQKCIPRKAIDLPAAEAPIFPPRVVLFALSGRCCLPLRFDFRALKVRFLCPQEFQRQKKCAQTKQKPILFHALVIFSKKCPQGHTRMPSRPKKVPSGTPPSALRSSSQLPLRNLQRALKVLHGCPQEAYSLPFNGFFQF